MGEDAHSTKSAKGGGSTKLLWAILGFIIIIATVFVTVFVLGKAASDSTKIPAEILQAQDAATYPLYYPEELPKGFSLDTSSVSVGANAALYSYIYDKNKRLSIGVQERDSSFSTDQFRPTSEFTTHIGRAYVVDLEERTTAAVIGEKSWVLINAPDKIALTELQAFIDSLRPVPQP
jgi:hypothetical protein